MANREAALPFSCLVKQPHALLPRWALRVPGSNSRDTLEQEIPELCVHNSVRPRLAWHFLLFNCSSRRPNLMFIKITEADASELHTPANYFAGIRVGKGGGSHAFLHFL